MHVLKLAATGVLISSASAILGQNCRKVTCGLSVLSHKNPIGLDKLNDNAFHEALISQLKQLQLARGNKVSIENWSRSGDELNGFYYFTNAEFKKTHNPTAADGYVSDGGSRDFPNVKDDITIRMFSCSVGGKVYC